MNRLFPFATALIVATASMNAFAQTSSPYFRYGHDERHGPSDRHLGVDGVDLRVLDKYSCELAKIIRCLQRDSHGLTRKYACSNAIAAYVGRVDHLQRHMHVVLQVAARTPCVSPALIHLVKNNVRQVDVTLNRLDRELRSLGPDVACPADYQRILRMRRAIVRDAYPLLGRMESALCGRPVLHVPSPRHIPSSLYGRGHSTPYGRSAVRGDWDSSYRPLPGDSPRLVFRFGFSR